MSFASAHVLRGRSCASGLLAPVAAAREAIFSSALSILSSSPPESTPGYCCFLVSSCCLPFLSPGRFLSSALVGLNRRSPAFATTHPCCARPICLLTGLVGTGRCTCRLLCANISTQSSIPTPKRVQTQTNSAGVLAPLPRLPHQHYRQHYRQHYTTTDPRHPSPADNFTPSGPPPSCVGLSQ